MNLIMKITSFRINGRSVSRLSINGKAVSLGQEPVLCDALCFTAQEAGSTVKLTKVKSAPDVNLQTSTNGSSWTPYAVNDVITLTNVDDKVYFKAVGSNSAMGSSSSNYNNFVMTGKIAASGNVNSLLEEDKQTARTMSLVGKNNCYDSMFKGCTSLTQAPELPATTLAGNCYESMFQLCSSLTKAPELPATTLDVYCYSSMFKGCTSLTTAPKLPATTLARRCYNSMFSSCTSLTKTPELPATTLAVDCYTNMFQNCSSLAQAPALPATTLVSNCYDSMFKGCTSLTTAPKLPARNTAGECYSNMFNGCTSLTTAPELPATTLIYNCYYSMFNGCTSLSSLKVAFKAWGNQTSNWLNNVAATGTFECPQALIDNTTERTTSTVPEGWTMVAV